MCDAALMEFPEDFRFEVTLLPFSGFPPLLYCFKRFKQFHLEKPNTSHKETNKTVPLWGSDLFVVPIKFVLFVTF